MRQGLISFLIVFILMSGTGCSFLKKNLADEGLPADRELVFDKAKDYTYLVVLDSIMMLPGWELQFTDKSSGKVEVYDTRFREVTNSDERVVTIWVKPVERNKTAVSLDKASTMKYRANELLDAIEDRMGRVASQIIKPSPQDQQQLAMQAGAA